MYIIIHIIPVGDFFRPVCVGVWEGRKKGEGMLQIKIYNDNSILQYIGHFFF